MAKLSTLEHLADEHGTPLFIVDHDIIRKNYLAFKEHLPRVQIFYAVKANSDPDIIKTLYDMGSSFDVASMNEFLLVHKNIESLSEKERQKFIWEKIIYANPIKDIKTLKELDSYKPLVTFDNIEEIAKIKQHSPNAGLVLRIKVPNTGAMVELSSKFGAEPGSAVEMIEEAHKQGLVVEGLSFHVGSQTTNFENYIQALSVVAGIIDEAKIKGYKKLKIVDIGGGFPAPYDVNVEPFNNLARRLNSELDRLFDDKIEIIAEPGRYMVATACTSVSSVIGKADREGKRCYYINDGVYHTFSGIIFDHCSYHLQAFKTGPKQICSVFGPTCDALDTISLAEELPELEIGEMLYSENIGAYSRSSSTWFNGFPPASIVHINK
ncbi:MAG: type III PLP-dependent enzyme [Spirochaetales bacterium]|uniref:ornithine decarboxylase n=1 Tax=Candidatus Thalassospirochaeta sargassi TaxID=3119039 RepID=A0AAJ1ICQ5_9SPIO|nr:type III PLP-dependent enzyme [Spirochaetales bacterium]